MKPLVESFLKERGLELSAEKTHITRIEDGFDFLGQNVRDYGGTIVVKPSRKNVATFLEKVRGIIKASKHVTAGHLIVNLNPVIRGWANYHRHVASKRTFTSGPRDLSCVMAVGQTEAPQEVQTMDQRPILRDHRPTALGLSRHSRRPGGGHPTGLAPRRLKCADPATYQGQRGSESLRPRLGTVLRGTSRREDGRDPGRPMDSPAALEGARRYLSGLQPEDHHGDGVAQPPYRVANPWGQGYD